MKPADDGSFEEIEALRTQITNGLEPFVRLLGVEDGRRIEATASAVLVTRLGRPMLITAHHALSNLAGGTLLLEIPERFHGLNLNRDVLATNDQIDAAVILLPDTAFDWDIEFLNLDMQAEPPTRDRPQMFVAMGFPWRETLVDYKARTLSLKTVNYWTIEKMDAYRLLHLSRDHFLLTNFDKEKALRGGVRRGMKAPHGMSGGALWRVWGFDGGTSSGIGLAGILTEYRTTPTKCMVSARVEVVQTMIEELLNRTTSGPSGHA